MPPKKTYTLYILKCADRTLYTGITTNIKKRLIEHNTSPKGAKYTRGRRPVTIAYTQTLPSHSEALKCEYAIKKLPRQKKVAIINSSFDARKLIK